MRRVPTAIEESTCISFVLTSPDDFKGRSYIPSQCIQPALLPRKPIWWGRGSQPPSKSLYARTSSCGKHWHHISYSFFPPIITFLFIYFLYPSMMLAHYLPASHTLCHLINHYLSPSFHIPHSHSLNPSHPPLPSLSPTLYSKYISFTTYNTFFPSLLNSLFLLFPYSSLSHKHTLLIHNDLFLFLILTLFLYP